MDFEFDLSEDLEVPSKNFVDELLEYLSVMRQLLHDSPGIMAVRSARWETFNFRLDEPIDEAWNSSAGL